VWEITEFLYIFKVDYPWTYAPFSYGRNGENFMSYNCLLESVEFDTGVDNKKQSIGSWRAGIDSPIEISAEEQNIIPNNPSRPKYRVVTNEVKAHFHFKFWPTISGFTK